MSASEPEANEQPPSTSVGDVICPQCGAANPFGTKVCRATPTCGSFLPANQAARTIGTRAQHHPLELREAVVRFLEAVVIDRGGDAELSTLERAYVQKLSELDLTIRLLVEDIAANGLLTPGGKVRGSYDKLLAGLTVFDRYAQRVGLDRRAKRVESISDIVREHREGGQ